MSEKIVDKYKLVLSDQAQLITRNSKSIDMDDLMNWFVNIRKISIDGGDVIDYLEYRENKK